MPSLPAPQFDPAALARARHAVGLSRKRLASDAQLSWEQLRKYERGQAVPSFNVACRLAWVLGMELSTLAAPAWEEQPVQTRHQEQSVSVLRRPRYPCC